MHKTEIALPTAIGNDTGKITLVPQLEVLQQSLHKEGLTSLQQLNKSGNLLLQSMEKAMIPSNGVDAPTNFNVMEVVECAKALAATVQTQSNLVKVLKDFIK